MSDPANTESVEVVSLTGTSVGRFAIKERIGAGGMGEVYRAQDTKLNRSVAIKRMAGAMRSDPAQRKRFFKEAERVSQLTDPHIAALYDILEENGEIFLVMELVEGCNLRDRLKRKTSLKELIEIAIQVAGGLRSAHARQIIHCDIKPENIMINDSGQVKVLDFGLARQLRDSGPHASSLLTGSGAVSGTPGYMAPEVMVDEAPDPRSDIFALGVVLYEALSGQHPFLKRTVFETADSVLHAQPAPLESVGVPVHLSQIVARMMEKEPARRYQNIDELLGQLYAFGETVGSQINLPRSESRSSRSVARSKRYYWIATAALVLIGAAVLLGPATRGFRRMKRVLGFSKAPQIAVLPFQNIGGQPSEQAFADGLSDVITSELSQLSDRYLLQVVPSSELRAEHVTSAKGARQQFGVDLVVEGSLQPVANMVRATFSVVDANTGRQVRAGTISVPASDPFGLQDQLASSIVRSLGIDVSASERNHISARGTSIPAAYDDYLQGLGYLEDYQKRENLDLAISAFNLALSHDSSYALAYAGLGEAHWHKYRELNDTAEMSDATLACQRAAAIDPELVEAHRCLGEVYADSGKYTEAAQELELALKKRPTDDESVRALGMAYEKLRQFDKAEATYQRAIDLRPHYWAGYNWMGAFYASRGQYAKALQMFDQVMAIAPENYRGYSNAGGIRIFQGDFAEATRLFERSVQIKPALAAYSNLGTAYFFQRQFQKAATAYSKALEFRDRDYVTWGNLGDAQYFTPGERNLSPASYQKAIELAEQNLKVNPKDAGALGSIAMYYAMLGQHQEAQKYLQRALELKPEGPDYWWQASVVYSQAGRSGDTLSALSSALAAGLSSSYISSAAYFDDLHSDARFQQLIRSAEKLERH
jgi:serine/threonine protein kinase/tetratricopeptide (TPR) repeat protein